MMGWGDPEGPYMEKEEDYTLVHILVALLTYDTPFTQHAVASV